MLLDFTVFCNSCYRYSVAIFEGIFPGSETKIFLSRWKSFYCPLCQENDWVVVVSPSAKEADDPDLLDIEKRYRELKGDAVDPKRPELPAYLGKEIRFE